MWAYMDTIYNDEKSRFRCFVNIVQTIWLHLLNKQCLLVSTESVHDNIIDMPTWSISIINFLFIFWIFCIISWSFMISVKTKRHKLWPACKNKFIGAVIAGKRIAKAAHFFGIKDPTAQSIWKKYKKMGSTKNLMCSGCPEKLSDCDKCLLIRTAWKEWWTPFGELRNKLGLQVGETTVHTILAQAGYHWRVACKKPFLPQSHCSLCIA